MTVNLGISGDKDDSDVLTRLSDKVNALSDRVAGAVDADPKDDGALYLVILDLDTGIAEVRGLVAELSMRVRNVREGLEGLGLL